MATDSAEILRANEKLLRRCGSITAGIKAVPELIHDPENCDFLDLLGTHQGGNVYRLNRLRPTVYILPGFLEEEECLELSREILQDLIDSPPHSNNFGEPSSETAMWKEYMSPLSVNPRLKKLRWSCVGYHYNWGERTYDPTKKSTFPSSFSDIYHKVLRTINNVSEGAEPLMGMPESAIINFYHTHRISDRLGGHRDDVETTDKTPLVSVSLGVPGFFLIENEAILLRTGDVLVMADEARQSLHGVPSVVGQNDRRASGYSGEEDERGLVRKFLSETRVSISIRQVY